MRFKNLLSRQLAFVGVLLAAGAMLLGLAPAAHAAGNNNMKIYAFYGAGDLAKSEYAQDTIILFNPTQAAISLNGWSIQRGVGASGSTTSVVTYTCTTANPPVCTANNNFFMLPNVTVPAGGYFTMAVSSPKYKSGVGCVSNNCGFNYDYQYHTIEGTNCDGNKDPATTLAHPATCTAADNILSSTNDFVMLVNNTSGAKFTTTGSNCVASTNVVDYVGIGNASGSATTCWEGTGYASYNIGVAANTIAYPLGVVRKNPCIDTDNNDQDFTNAQLPTNYGLTGPRTVCPVVASTSQLLLQSAAITSPHLHATDVVTVTATVRKATGGGNTTVTVYATDLGGPVTGTPLYDDGTHGDATAGDGIYTNNAFQIPFTPVTAYYLTVVATDATGVQSRGNIYVPLENGVFTITSTSGNYTGTVNRGGVLTFPIKVQGSQGYFGYVNLTCQNVPSRMQCVITPPTVDLSGAPNASGTASLSFAAGTTSTSSLLSKSLPTALAGVLAAMLLAVGVWRRKHLPVASLLALIAFLSLSSTGCETNAGLGDTQTPAGTYNITVMGLDNYNPTIANSATFTITVK